jgi:hypothetical protein
MNKMSIGLCAFMLATSLQSNAAPTSNIRSLPKRVMHVLRLVAGGSAAGWAAKEIIEIMQGTMSKNSPEIKLGKVVFIASLVANAVFFLEPYVNDQSI